MFVRAARLIRNCLKSPITWNNALEIIMRHDQPGKLFISKPSQAGIGEVWRESWVCIDRASKHMSCVISNAGLPPNLIASKIQRRTLQKKGIFNSHFLLTLRLDSKGFKLNCKSISIIQQALGRIMI